ncbi:Vacuolar protein-sorting-associated protein 27, partial [Basidiobolus ranarum]
MDNLVAILKNSTSVNREVKYKILDLIKSWAEAFHSKNELFYIQQVYKRLEVEGYPFPKTSRVNPNLFDTTTVPEWSDSDVCMRCRTPFTITTRKHHCRNCGQTFCQPCSSNNTPLPHFGVHESVRVCHGCYLKLKKVVGPIEVSENINSSQTSRAATATVATGIQSTPNEDDDLKRAIELSLKEAQNRFGHASISRPNSIENSKIEPNVNEDEEANLATAIAASLRETHISQTWPDPTKQLQSNNQNQRTASFPGELSTSEKENIEMFATLVSRIQQSGDDPTRDSNIQELYGEVGALQSKLVQNLEDSMQQHRSYVQLYDKITTAVKLYERLLEERLSNIHITQPLQRNTNDYRFAHPQTYPRLSSVTQQYPQKKSYVDYSKYPSSSRASHEDFTSRVEHPTNHSHLQQYGYMYPPICFTPEQRNPYTEVVAMSSGSEQNGYTRPADPRSQAYFNFTNDNSTNSQSGYCKNVYPQQLAPAPLVSDSLQTTHTWHPANPSNSHFDAATSSYHTYPPPKDT